MSFDPTVAICLPTYKRPQFLEDAIASIRALEIDGFQGHLIVVDNDQEESALKVVARAEDELPIPVSYFVEPARGLASVRNRLVCEAMGLGAEYVAFVDDDQVVTPSWLRELVSVAFDTNADAVVGRWIPHFEPGVATWVQSSGFWNRKWGTTGSPARNFGTGNILIKLAPLVSIPGPFDERTNLIGGEDHLFFQQFMMRGYYAVWAYESLVHERVIPSRATMRWMVRRSFRVGLCHGLTVRWTDPTLSAGGTRIVKSVGLAFVNAAMIMPSATNGRAGVAVRLSNIARGVGGILGVLGIGRRFTEYESVHGH